MTNSEHEITICPDCGEPIHWFDIIQTGLPGQSNYIEGECSCAAWENREEGGDWSSYYTQKGLGDWERVEVEE